MLKKIVIFIVICIFSISFVSAKKFTNKVVAIVGDESILMSDFNKVADPIIESYTSMAEAKGGISDEDLQKLKEDILDQMIIEKLVIQEAKNKNISVSRRKKDSALEEVKRRFPSEEDFEKELKNQQLTEKQFKEKLEEQLKMMEIVNQEVRSKVAVPTDEEAQEYYDNNKALMVEPEAVRIRHILVKIDERRNEKEAFKKIKDVETKLKNGENFSDLAKKYSDDQGTSARGGDLGLFIKGQMVPEFEEKAFLMNVGEISDPVQTQFGYHILRCEEKRLEQKKEFMEIKENIKEFLYNKKTEEAYKKWIDGLRESTNISIKGV